MAVVVAACDPSPLSGEIAVDTPFVSRNMRKRIDPSAVLDGVRSVIVVGVGRCVDEHCTSPVEGGLVELSSLGTDDDYHPIVKSHLQELALELERQQDAFRYKILVDSGTLDERAFAVRAGIGFIGRHGLVISPELGTRFNIGLLLTTMPVEELPFTLGNSKSVCPPDCNHCIKACPTGALQEGRRLDFSRCLSYLTQKKNLTAHEETLIKKGGQLYGCDICQNACRHNLPKQKTYVNPQDWLEKPDIDFIREYGHTAMLWQGATLLRRNAGIFL